MNTRRKIVDVQFYKSDAGNAPVKEWLKKLAPRDRKIIGDDIRTIEFGKHPKMIWAQQNDVCQILKGKNK